MVDVTCALLVVDPDNNVLIAHPTGASWKLWSVPKGIKDPGETEVEAAARECFEECGLDFRSELDKFVDLGRRPYAKGKDYHLFLYRIDQPLDIKSLCCTTTFTRDDAELPEVDSYRVVTFKKALELLNPKQAVILREHEPVITRVI